MLLIIIVSGQKAGTPHSSSFLINFHNVLRIHLITVRQNVPGKRGARGEKSGPRNSERFLPSQIYAARPVPVPLTVKEKSTFRKPRKAAPARYPSPAVRSPENLLPPSRASALLPAYKSAQPVPVL